MKKNENCIQSIYSNYSFLHSFSLPYPTNIIKIKKNNIIYEFGSPESIENEYLKKMNIDNNNNKGNNNYHNIETQTQRKKKRMKKKIQQ